MALEPTRLSRWKGVVVIWPYTAKIRPSVGVSEVAYNTHTCCSWKPMGRASGSKLPDHVRAAVHSWLRQRVQSASRETGIASCVAVRVYTRVAARGLRSDLRLCSPLSHVSLAVRLRSARDNPKRPIGVDHGRAKRLRHVSASLHQPATEPLSPVTMSLVR